MAPVSRPLVVCARILLGANFYRWPSRFLLATVLLVSGSLALTAQAQVSYNLTEDVSLYGHLDQHSTSPYWGGATPGNMCGPTSATNSLVYLQNEYPSIYGQALVPGCYVNGQPSQAAMISTADLIAGPNYMACTGEGVTPMTYIAGQTNYIEAYIPNTTVYSSQVNWYGNGYGQAGVVTPTWQSIYDGLLTDSAVNISIWGGDNHCLSVTGFHWTDYQQDGIIDASDNATIDVVDPYTGLNETFSIWQDSANGMLHMADVLSPDSQIMSVMVTTPAQWNGQGSAELVVDVQLARFRAQRPRSNGQLLELCDRRYDGHSGQFANGGRAELRQPLRLLARGRGFQHADPLPDPAGRRRSPSPTSSATAPTRSPRRWYWPVHWSSRRTPPAL